MSAERASLRAVLAALAANLGVALAKLIGFVLSGSGSMLAEFAHSVADTGNQTVLLLGRRRSQRRPDPSHPFGYGAFRFLGAFIVAEVLFGLGALFSVAQGVLKLVQPHPLERLPLALGILGVTLVLEALSFRTAIVAARQTKRERGWLRFVRTTRIPELAVLLVEDSGALVGLAIAFVAVTLSAVTGRTVFDAVGSLAIGVLLAVNSVLLGTEMTSLLVGESASPGELDTIQKALSDTAGVATVIHLRAVHLGPEELLVAAKVVFEPGMSADEAAKIVDDAEVAIRASVPTSHWVYIEPGRP